MIQFTKKDGTIEKPNAKRMKVKLYSNRQMLSLFVDELSKRKK